MRTAIGLTWDLIVLIIVFMLLFPAMLSPTLVLFVVVSCVLIVVVFVLAAVALMICVLSVVSLLVTVVLTFWSVLAISVILFARLRPTCFLRL